MTTTSTSSPLLVDLYELTMAESYLAEGLADCTATFQLTCRRLPRGWGYLVAAGLEGVLDFLEGLRFGPDDIQYLESTGRFTVPLLEHLAALRFTGGVRAVSEGTIVFPDEPLVEVTGPVIEAQLAETAVLNHVHFQTIIASKAARCVEAADGRTLVDFGLRRTHGLEAGLLVARASWLAGFAATSNVLAGRRYGIPIAGTMAHSYVECFETEIEAFEAYVRSYPDGGTLLVDTYDTLEGTRRAALVARRLEERGGRLAAIRLDSGDLLELSLRSRALLDEAGLDAVQIFASGGLDEHEIVRLVERGAPIDAFGVGSRLGVAADAPYLDMAYKLSAFDGRPTLKLSTGKLTLPGTKQVWRRSHEGVSVRDVLALEDEPPVPGAEPLLHTVMRDGATVTRATLADGRERAVRSRSALPPELRALDAAGIAPSLSTGVTELRDRAIATATTLNAPARAI
jgi:nicotinate phosphoribosyltransferase